MYTIRNNKSGGGVAIYINNNLNINILHNQTFNIDNLIDICTIELIYNNTNIILSRIYRPPYSKIDSYTNIISNYYIIKQFIYAEILILLFLNIIIIKILKISLIIFINLVITRQ